MIHDDIKNKENLDKFINEFSFVVKNSNSNFKKISEETICPTQNTNLALREKEKNLLLISINQIIAKDIYNTIILKNGNIIISKDSSSSDFSIKKSLITFFIKVSKIDNSPMINYKLYIDNVFNSVVLYLNTFKELNVRLNKDLNIISVCLKEFE